MCECGFPADYGTSCIQGLNQQSAQSWSNKNILHTQSIIRTLQSDVFIALATSPTEMTYILSQLVTHIWSNLLIAAAQTHKSLGLLHLGVNNEDKLRWYIYIGATYKGITIKAYADQRVAWRYNFTAQFALVLWQKPLMQWYNISITVTHQHQSYFGTHAS